MVGYQKSKCSSRWPPIIIFTCIDNISTFIHVHSHKHTVYQQYKHGDNTLGVAAGAAADPGISVKGPAPLFPSSPLLFLHFLSLPLLLSFPYTFHLPVPLEVGRFKSAREHCKLRSGVRAEPRPKTNLVHSRAVRKPLVAIILSILKCMFYSRTIKI